MSNPAEQEETIRDWVRNWPNERESSDLRYLLGEIDSLRTRIAELVAGRDLQPLLDRIAALERERDGLNKEVEQWKIQSFRPLGDNHHNAAKCPYCRGEL